MQQLDNENVSCKHGQRAPAAVLDSLDVSQAGVGRHKCPVCAYRAGFDAGIAVGIRRAQEALAGLTKGVSE